MHAFAPHTSLSLNTNKMVNEEDMRKALNEIERFKKPNYAAIVEKHHLE
jgi:hypothetical protein